MSYRGMTRFTRAVGVVCIALAGLQAEPGPILAGLNENAFGPSPAVPAAVAAELPRINRYVGREAEELAALIARKEGVAPEQILLGEVLEALGAALGANGGEFVYSVPGYPALVNAAEHAGGKVVAVPLNERLENDLPSLSAKLGPATHAVFLVNPHNPSGTVNGAGAFDAFVGRAARGAVVVVDEAYLDFCDDYAQRTAVRLIRQGENVVVFRTFAKIYGLAGISLGYAVAPRALADQLRKRGVGDVHGLNRLAVAAATASLRDEGFVPSIRAKVAVERKAWNDFLDERRMRHTDARGNFVYFETRQTQAEVARALAAEGIQVGRAFPPLDHWTRITIGLPEENQRIRNALSKLLQKP